MGQCSLCHRHPVPRRFGSHCACLCGRGHLPAPRRIAGNPPTVDLPELQGHQAGVLFCPPIPHPHVLEQGLPQAARGDASLSLADQTSPAKGSHGSKSRTSGLGWGSSPWGSGTLLRGRKEAGKHALQPGWGLRFKCTRGSYQGRVPAPTPESRMPSDRDSLHPTRPVPGAGDALTRPSRVSSSTMATHSGGLGGCWWGGLNSTPNSTSPWRCDPGLLKVCESLRPLHQPAPSQGYIQRHGMNGTPRTPGPGHHGEGCVPRSNVAPCASLITSSG